MMMRALILLASLGVAEAADAYDRTCRSNCRRRGLAEEDTRFLADVAARRAKESELEAFEDVMKSGLRGRNLKVGECGHDCSCFTCGDVTAVAGGYEITVNHCKGSDISWMCCTGTSEGGKTTCDTSCGSNKCEGVGPSEFKVTVSSSATSFTINTHDGQTAGNANMNNDACGGSGNQGGKCANQGTGTTAHCEITFDIANDCGVTPEPPTCNDEDCVAPPNLGLCDNGMCLPRPECVCVDPVAQSGLAYWLNYYGFFIQSFATMAECEAFCDDRNGPGPGGMGDPHLRNWKGQYFDYMGECDLKFLYTPLFDGKNTLEIAIRTTIRDWYSFIEAAAVRIGNDILEFDGFGNYVLNDVEGALNFDENEAPIDVPTLAGYPVHFTQENKKHTKLDIILNDQQNITFKSFKDWVSVFVTPGDFNGVNFQKSFGMMGTVDGLMLSRNGTDLSEDINALAEDWQYRDHEESLFRSKREPQWPNKCILPTVSQDGISLH